MKTMLKRKKVFSPLFLLIALVSLILSCPAEPPDGIFMSLAKENPVDLNSTKTLDGSSPTALEYLAGTGKFYLAANSLYEAGTTKIAGGRWTSTSAVSGKVCLAMASTGAKIYAAFAGPTGTESSASAEVKTSDGSDWLPVPALEGKLVSGIFALGLPSGSKTVFVLIKESTAESGYDTYSLKYLDSSDALQPIAAMSSVKIAYIHSAVFDGTNYIFASKNAFYSAATPSGITEYALASDTGVKPDLSISSIASIAWAPLIGKTLVVSNSINTDEDCRVYARDPAGAWEKSSMLAVSDANYILSCAIEIPDSSGNPAILIGTRSTLSSSSGSPDGYLVRVPSSLSTPDVKGDEAKAAEFSTTTNYATTLSNLALDGFSWVPNVSGESSLFAFCPASGLWSNVYSSSTSSWSGWEKE